MPEGVGVSERVTSGAEDESACREAGDTGGASTSDVASSTSGIFSLRVCTLHRAQNQPLVVCWSEEPQGSDAKRSAPPPPSQRTRDSAP